MNRIFFSMSAILFVLVAPCSDIWAQGTAEVSGRVTDPTGAVLPGVEVTVTQTNTGAMRSAISNETGSYVLPNLPIGPYRLEASLPGFRTYIQTGIVMQVNSSPTINLVMQVGQVAETLEVQANAAMVETRRAGVGEVMENTRILELPLDGRAVIDLVGLAGGATPAPALTGGGGRAPFNRGDFSIAGGMQTGVSYTLDGGHHQNPYTNGYLSMPFPDALEEFRVESGATGADTGTKSSGSVSMITKSGTNEFHGNVFWFTRHGNLNARDFFATERDMMKRNQFGGTIGGPIAQNKLFFFAGYQGTAIRREPAATLAIVPTPAMLNGDFTVFASAACQGRDITLRAPFVDNRIDPALFSSPAVRLASKLPGTDDPCGAIRYEVADREDSHQALGRIDYQWSASHTLFGRYTFDDSDKPAPYNLDGNVLNTDEPGITGRAHAFTLGSTYLFGANIVNALRLTANRQVGGKIPADYADAGVGPDDLGIKSFVAIPHRPKYSVTGGFNSSTGGFAPDGANETGLTQVATFSISDDVDIVRGNHQMAFGAQMSYWQVNSYSTVGTGPTFRFRGQAVGLGMADFFLGKAESVEGGTGSQQQKRGKYFALYGADTWQVSPKFTVTYGLRWEPYLPLINKDGGAIGFDEDALRQGVQTARFTDAPPGVSFNGDLGFPGEAGQHKQWRNMSPRLGLAWDVLGDGRTSIRASTGVSYDYPGTLFLAGLTTGAPFSPRIRMNAVDFADPWADFAGGDPFPIPTGPNIPRETPWPQYSNIIDMDFDTPNVQVYQWNLSLQRQFGIDWLASANYIGSHTVHLWSVQQTNSAIFFPGVFDSEGTCARDGRVLTGGRPDNPCSTTRNEDQRRRLALDYPAPGIGDKFGNVGRIDSGGTASYNGLVLSIQRRAARGLSLSGNYTWSHCISDPWMENINSSHRGGGWLDSNNRSFDRGNCVETGHDRRHNLNLSAVVTTPEFSNPTLRAVGSGWRVSSILKVLSGGYLSVTTSRDRALSGVSNQRVDQILPDVYGDKSIDNYLNPEAFALPALGTLGNIGRNSIAGPGTWQWDAALARTFQFGEAQRLEFRAEAFNVTNSLRMNNPITNFNSGLFGRVTSAQAPRIMQLALKYFF